MDMSADGRLAVLFADVVGSTALYQQLGDLKAERVIRAAMARVEALTAKCSGRLVKTIGDCALCVFPSPNDAALVAVHLHRASVSTDINSEDHVSFRVGFAYGPVVTRNDDIFGDVVNLAARICDMAKSGQTLTVEATAAEMSVEFQRKVRVFDKATIKGFSDVMTVVQVLWDRRTETQIFMAPSTETQGIIRCVQLKYAGGDFNLSPDRLPFTIGRGEGCSLVVSAPCSSRVHARLEQHRGKFVLIDESTNGTYIWPEGVPLNRAVYIRRESFALLGRGAISLGERPRIGSASFVSYEAD